MKKIISVFLFVVLNFCLSAQTGYRGHSWYSNVSDFPKSGQLVLSEYDRPSLGYDYPLIYEKKILGDKIFVFYNFDLRTDELNSVGYIISKDKTAILKEEFKNLKKREFQVDLENLSEYQEEDVQYVTDYFCFAYSLQMARFMEEGEEIKQSSKRTAIKITVYDYNDDTRVYIFENVINGRSAVVYVPHEQDY